MSASRNDYGIERDFGLAPIDVSESISEVARNSHKNPGNRPPLSSTELLLARAIVRKMVPPTITGLAPLYPSSPEMVVTRAAIDYVKKMALLVGCNEDLPPEDVLPPHRDNSGDIQRFVEVTIGDLEDLTQRPTTNAQIHEDLEYIAGESKYTRLAHNAIYVSIAALEATRLDYEVFGSDLPAFDEDMAAIEKPQQ